MLLHKHSLVVAVLLLLLPSSVSSFSSMSKKRHRIDPLYSRVSSSSSSSTDSPTTRPAETEMCELGINAVEECKTLQPTESQLSVVSNLSKCICGAGSFALPHVFLKEGVLGGTLAMTLCGGLAAYTMTTLSQAKQQTQSTSYVELAQSVLDDKRAGILVFLLTLCASLGVCSTYLVFIGQTLESLSMDATSNNLMRQVLPGISCQVWEAAVAVLLIPLCLIRDYSIFAFTSALGVICVVGGILVTLAYGITVDPGWQVAMENMHTLPLWPESLAAAFGGSFGTIAYLFCINFLTFPIMNSMKEPERFGSAVSTAVAGVWLVNGVFAILCLGFYGDDTQDLVLANLDNGPYLSALKLLLCIDLLFTFPIVFSSGRQILENALIDKEDAAVERTVLVTGAVSACFGLAQIGGFGDVANLVGGVAQGTLAFIMPPAIAITLARQKPGQPNEIGQWLVGAFGVVVVSAVTYSTAVGMRQ